MSASVTQEVEVLLSPEEIARRVESLVAQLTPVPDMALLIGISERELRDHLDDLRSPVATAYRSAKARVALKLRLRDIELAEAGSPTAAAEVAAHFRRMEQSE